MGRKKIRVRVRDGRLEPLERLPLAEGAEVDVTVELPEPLVAAARLGPRAERGVGCDEVEFSAWDLGAKVPLTRADIYGDIG